MSVSFVKLFATITDSSIWDLPDDVCKIWITMLAMANSRGNVHAAITGVANRARKSVADVERALAIFKAPDPYSRTKDHEGRRVVDIEGGWQIINYTKHREALRAEQVRESKRVYAAAMRDAMRATKAANLNDLSTEVDISRKASNSCSLSLSLSSGSDLDRRGVQGGALPPGVFDAPVIDGKRGRVAPANFEPTDAHRMRAAELKLDIAAMVREFKAFEFNRDYSDWDRRFSRWIEDARVRAETDRGKALSGAGTGPRTSFARSPQNPCGWEPNAKHTAFALKFGLDLQRYAKSYILSGAVADRSVADANRDFGLRLVRVSRGEPFGVELAA